MVKKDMDKIDITSMLKSVGSEQGHDLYHGSTKIGEVVDGEVKISHGEYRLEIVESAIPTKMPKDLPKKAQENWKPKMCKLVQCRVFRVT